MAEDLGTLRAAINADTKGWTKGFGGATKTLTGFAKAVPKMLKPVGIAVAAIGTATVAAATVMAVKTTKEFAGFQQEMANVSTMIREDSVAMTETLADAVLDLSREIPQVTSELTSALYDILSASVPVSESMNMLEESGRAAVAGVSNVQTAANLATGTINALGLSFSDADKVFDIAFSTVQSGKITFEELAGSLGQVLPSAKKMNSSIEEVYGSIAFLTKNAFSADMASVSLARALDALGTKSADLEDMGVQVFGEKGEYVGIVEVVTQISGLIEGLTAKAQVDIFKEMGFDIRAARALVTMATNLESFKDTMDEVSDSADAADEAYGKLEGTLVNQWQLLQNSFSALWIEIGEGFSGMALSGIISIKDLVNKISKLIGSEGGMPALWEAHGQMIIDTFGTVSRVGVELVGTLMTSMADIVVAMAPLVWEPLKFAFEDRWRQLGGSLNVIMEGVFGALHLKSKEDVEEAQAFYLKHYFDWQVEAQAEYSEKMKVATGKATGEIETILTGLGGAVTEGLKESTAAVHNLLDEMVASTETASLDIDAGFKDMARVLKATMEAGTRAVGQSYDNLDERATEFLDGSLSKTIETNQKRVDSETETLGTIEHAEDQFFIDKNEKIKENSDTIALMAADFRTDELTDGATHDAALLQSEKDSAWDILEETNKLIADRKENEDAAYEERKLAYETHSGNIVDAEQTKTTDLTTEFTAQYDALNTNFQDMKTLYEEFGGDTTELERTRNDAIQTLVDGTVTNFLDGLGEEIGGFRAFSTLHESLYGTWLGNIFGMAETSHGTMLTQFGNWVQEQLDLLDDLKEGWKLLVEVWDTAKSALRTVLDLYDKYVASGDGGGGLPSFKLPSVGGGGGQLQGPPVPAGQGFAVDPTTVAATGTALTTAAGVAAGANPLVAAAVAVAVLGPMIKDMFEYDPLSPEEMEAKYGTDPEFERMFTSALVGKYQGGIIPPGEAEKLRAEVMAEYAALVQEREAPLEKALGLVGQEAALQQSAAEWTQFLAEMRLPLKEQTPEYIVPTVGIPTPEYIVPTVGIPTPEYIPPSEAETQMIELMQQVVENTSGVDVDPAVLASAVLDALAPEMEDRDYI